MHASTKVGLALGIVTIWLPAGCSSFAPSPVPAGGGLAARSVALQAPPSFRLAPSVLVPRAAARLHPVGAPVVEAIAPDQSVAQQFVYSCQYYGSDCHAYNAANHKVVRTLNNQKDGLVNPEGTAVGARGIWYIANTGAGTIAVFSSGGKKKIKTIADTGQFPVDVTASKGNVIVSNIYGASFAAGSVSVFPSRGSPYQLTDGNAFEGSGVAVDGSGNCYWSYNDNLGFGEIDEFAGCKGSPTNLGVKMGFAGGLAFDGAGNLWYTDQIAGIYECTGTASCALVDADGTNLGAPLFMNFNRGWQRLYVADALNGAIDGVDPATGKISTFATTSASDPPFGVAAGPAPKE